MLGAEVWWLSRSRHTQRPAMDDRPLTSRITSDFPGVEVHGASSMRHEARRNEGDRGFRPRTDCRLRSATYRKWRSSESIGSRDPCRVPCPQVKLTKTRQQLAAKHQDIADRLMVILANSVKEQAQVGWR